MFKLLVATFFLATLYSCSLTSTTLIKPTENFELGNNVHGKFTVQFKNISNSEIDIYQAPIDGGKHSTVSVAPNKKIKVKVDKNTALIIKNKSMDSASVELKVTGDIGLSMGYIK